MTCMVLCYHRVMPDGTGGVIGNCHRARGTVVSLPTFQRHLADIGRHFRPVTLRDYVATLEGRSTLPPNTCLITFDDGYRDFAEHALPALERHSMPCVLFATVEQACGDQPLAPPDAWYAILVAATPPIGDLASWVHGPRTKEHHYAPPSQQPKLRAQLARALDVRAAETGLGRCLYLNEMELRGLEGRGVALGGHGATHLAFTTLPDSDLAANLQACRAWLDRIAPASPATVAYPYGKADDRVARAAADAAFRAGFTVLPCDGKADAGPFFLKRSCVPDRPTAIEELKAGGRLSI